MSDFLSKTIFSIRDKIGALHLDKITIYYCCSNKIPPEGVPCYAKIQI